MIISVRDSTNTTESSEEENLTIGIVDHKRPSSSDDDKRYVLPAHIFSLPAAGPQKQIRKRRKRAKTKILTDTPEREKLELLHAGKLFKKHPKKELLRLNSQLTQRATSLLNYYKLFAMTSVMTTWMLSSQQKPIGQLYRKKRSLLCRVIKCTNDTTGGGGV